MLALARSCSLAALFLCLPAAADAAAPTVDQVVAGVERTYDDVQALKASFTQVVTSPAMGAGPAQSGEIMLARPRKMRWDFSVPDDKLFVTDGSTMWVYTPADKQVFVSTDLAGGDGTMDALLSSLDSLDELFEVSLLDGAPAGQVRLGLAPRKDSAQFKSLELDLSATDYRLQRLVLVDGFDNRTELSFSSLVINPTLADSVFTFQVPPGVQVIDSSGL